MVTYTKEQLMLVSLEVLQALAFQFDTTHKDSDNVDLLVADILDAQEKIVAGNLTVPPVRRKRGRPSKAEIEARKATEAMFKGTEDAHVHLTTNDETCALEVPSESESEEPKNEVLPSPIEDQPLGITESQETIVVTPVKKIDDNFFITKDLPELANSHAEACFEEEDVNDDFTSQENNTENFNLSTPPSDYTPNFTKNTTKSVNPDPILLDGGGVLELTKEGYGFLRSSDYNYLTSPDDVYVSPMLLRQYGLKPGDVVVGKIRVPREDDKFFVLSSVDTINGLQPIETRNRVAFEHLTPLFPDEKFKLCKGNKDSLSRRVVDIFAPIGKGQRALIVAPPKTGKTMLMKEIANAIAENHPETYLMMLLIDERPEEVTDMRRTVKAEVIASTFDAPASNHVKIAGIVLEKAKRMVECGQDVVIFLDSITRLARAYNTEAPASGKILSGGVDANSLQRPKRFFGAARNIEGGGSLTIIATALIETGSRMDEVIFEEFKGTGNMELQLDRQLANKRIFPAVNVIASSTRRDDLLLPPTTCNRMWILRNYLAELNAIEAMQEVIKRLDNTLNNEEMLMTMDR